MIKNDNNAVDREKTAFYSAVDVVTALLSKNKKFANSFSKLTEENYSNNIKSSDKNNFYTTKNINTLDHAIEQIGHDTELLKKLRTSFFSKDVINKSSESQSASDEKLSAYNITTEKFAETTLNHSLPDDNGIDKEGISLDSIENQKKKELLNKATSSFLSKDELQQAKSKNISIISTLNLIIDKVEMAVDKVRTLLKESRIVEEKTKLSILKSEQIDASRKELAPSDVGGDVLGKLTANIVQQLGEKIENFSGKFASKEAINPNGVEKKFDRTISKMTNVREEIEKKLEKAEGKVQLMQLTAPSGQDKKTAKGLSI